MVERDARSLRARRPLSAPLLDHLHDLSALDAAAQSKQNLMAPIVDAVRNECTVGEIVNTLKTTFGEHTDQGF